MAWLATENDRRIYFEYYQGTRLPVVLLHGWGASVRVWDTTLPALRAAGHPVLAFDQRGCGASDKDFAEVSIAAAARDTIALMDSLEIGPVILNGWSLGGAIAVAVAAQVGSRCAGVVLTSGATPRYTTASDFPLGNPPGTATATVAALREDRVNFLHNLTRSVPATPQSEASERWLWSIFMQAAPSADDALADLDQLDQRQILAALKVPVLSFVGDQDAVVAPAIGREAAQIAPFGRLVEFESCGHAPFLEHGPRYREELLAFLAAVSIEARTS